MNQFGRYRIGFEVFDSFMPIQHIKSSYILAKFKNSNEKVKSYPGQFNTVNS